MANPDKFIRLRDFAKIMRALRETDMDGTTFHYDESKHEYANVKEFYSQHRSGRIYGVQFPRYSFSHVPTGAKTHDNANLSVTVSTAANAGRDDYAYLNAFQWRDVNATVDDSGVPHITAIEGDSRFRRDGSNGDVFVMVAPGYFRIDGDDNHIELLYSDEQYDGFEPMPGLLLPDGTERPCLLFAKYAASLSGGIPRSWSSQKIDPGFGCQNDQIDLALKKGKGYAGQCQPDVFYFQLMLMLKFATKDMEAALGGCFENYTAQGPVTKAESNAKRVIIAKDTADNILVGSTINIGTDKERNNSGNHSMAEARTVLSKTTIDATNVALNIDAPPSPPRPPRSSAPCRGRPAPPTPSAAGETDARRPTTPDGSRCVCRASNAATASTRSTRTPSSTPTRTPTASATPPSTSCTTSPRHPRPAPTTTLS